MEILTLKASRREQIGRRQVKKIRADKQIPAVVYSKGTEAISIQFTYDDFHRVIHTKAGENAVIQLVISSGTGKPVEKTVVIKEIQQDPVTEKMKHIDFKAISLTEKIEVKVPLHVIGEAMGTKKGGILDVIHYEIEVKCLPTNIPEKFDVDVSGLDIGNSIHVKDMTFPSGVEILIDSEEVVIAVHAPKAEEVPAGEEAKAEPEVIGKEKKEGEAEIAPEAEKSEKSEKAEKKE